MAALFSQILNMSMTGSVVILLVMLARLILKRAPKIFSYALWSVVLFRLLCPVAFSAPISVLDVVEPELKETSNNTSMVSFIPAAVDTQADFVMVQPEEQPVIVREPEEQLLMTPMHAVALVWAAGTIGMILYSVVQYLNLRKKLVGSMQLTGNIYLADHIDTAFVVGLLMPQIYLPTSVPSKERYYILAHEQHHIRRFDHVIKLLAYLALCIHWFNPLVWIAFALAGKDMEMSCDEAVIKRLGAEIRADYSASLLRLATHKKILSGMPLAFGEGDTKGRVMNMAKWKKPRLWVSLICFLLCTTILVACAVNPKTAEAKDGRATGTVTTTSKGLNIRQEPTASSAVVGNYDDGTVITILETKDGWGRTDQGWVSLHYVTTMDGTSMVDLGQMEPAVDGTAPTDIENEFKELNIREKPDKSSAVIGQYPNGKIITILETRDGWGRTDQGWVYMDYVTTIDGNTVVDTSDFQPAVDGSFIITDTEMVQYGTLKMLLGPGFAARGQDGAIVLVKDSIDVGGITCWSHPGFEPDNIIEWMKALGIPELQDNFEVPIGYMAGNSPYGGWEIEIFQDGNPEALNEEHVFFIDGDVVYDVWYDQNLISDAIAEGFLKTVAINADPMVEVIPEEQEALAKCRAVLDAIQNGSYHVLFTRNDENAPSAYETEFLEDGEDWLTITSSKLNTGETEQIAHLYANGRFFSNQGHLSGTELVWEEVQDAVINGTEGFTKPWLASFLWRENVISYQGTMEQDGEISVMLRIDEAFPNGYDSDADYYFVNFTFDSAGKFLDVYIQCNMFMDNAFTEKESIVSLDPQTINAEIQKEFQNAIA